jgi:hypothetical protein
MEINLDFETPASKKRGRPRSETSGSNKGGRPSRLSLKKAKQFAKAVSNNPRHKGIKQSSIRLFGVKKRENPDHWKSIPRPERKGHDLSQDQIDSAIRTIYVMKE